MIVFLISGSTGIAATAAVYMAVSPVGPHTFALLFKLSPIVVVTNHAAAATGAHPLSILQNPWCTCSSPMWAVGSLSLVQVWHVVDEGAHYRPERILPRKTASETWRLGARRVRM